MLIKHPVEQIFLIVFNLEFLENFYIFFSKCLLFMVLLLFYCVLIHIVYFENVSKKIHHALLATQIHLSPIY